MPRRVSLPGAAELFRPTDDAGAQKAAEPAAPEAEKAATPRRTRRKATVRKATVPPFEQALPPASPAAATPSPATPPAPTAAQTAEERRLAASGRVRHDEKITVYVSRDELMALEQGRLTMRGEYGLAVDRGRIVRESIALAMADLAARGADSDLVRRLNGE